MTEEQLAEFKHSPASRPFFEFLALRRHQLTEAWAAGVEMTPHHQSMCQLFGDLLDLDYQRDIAPYYEESEEDDGE